MNHIICRKKFSYQTGHVGTNKL